MKRAALFLSALLLGSPVQAEEDASAYPSRTVKLVVPAAPGGIGHLLARAGRAHAAAQHVGAVDAEMVEQTGGLPDITLPRQRLDAPAGIAGFAAIIGDDLKLVGQRVQRPQFLPRAARRPARCRRPAA